MIQYLLKTTRFIPNEFHHSFFDINFQLLYDKGFRYIITDLDNTLISYDESQPTETIKNTFIKLQEMGFTLVLLSNNHTERINTFCHELHVDGFANAKKPFRYGFQKALRSMDGATKDKTVIIGDQLMTDIWGANRFGSYSILVNPLKRKTEKWYTKMNRKLEAKMLQRIQHKHPSIYQSLQLSERT
ncbi:YqeG family HAD IIIA-type phosphatase [Candidatus Xianfuyuplasma coldseepsis]|uniref:YqeG family HAD IIIA-type phosphatase n=1 Tax=Candidatus Xianfuyuplasma coldseepsis TaxID=2782163 RepID=A0A7L7KTJ2_9MOLU|nr:YqeG family HAD IIIA-type phosphatase [Xianfuyuplasma coldseepsis]QMS85622.1 YqeG family HAD IIIA-type phosphatase [Xianfuyuplasma coldseepsis]